MNIDRDTALRIALAARTLPDVDLPTLIGILNERLGAPNAERFRYCSGEEID